MGFLTLKIQVNITFLKSIPIQHGYWAGVCWRGAVKSLKCAPPTGNQLLSWPWMPYPQPEPILPSPKVDAWHDGGSSELWSTTCYTDSNILKYSNILKNILVCFFHLKKQSCLLNDFIIPWLLIFRISQSLRKAIQSCPLFTFPLLVLIWKQNKTQLQGN